MPSKIGAREFDAELTSTTRARRLSTPTTRRSAEFLASKTSSAVADFVKKVVEEGQKALPAGDE